MANRSYSSELVQLPSAPIYDLDAATKKYVDDVLAGKISKYGDTMVEGDGGDGSLYLAHDPVVANEAATKQYVDNKVASGPINASSIHVDAISGVDTTNGQTAFQSLADTRVLRAGDTMTGYLVLSGTGNNPYHAVTKAYADKQGTTIINFEDTATVTILPNQHSLSRKPNVETYRVLNATEISKIVGEVVYKQDSGDYTIIIKFNHNQTGYAILT